MKLIFDLIGIMVEGCYFFMVELVGKIYVYDKEIGKEVGVMSLGVEVGKVFGWVDVLFGISVFWCENGEYLVFVEEDVCGKVLMYCWKL